MRRNRILGEKLGSSEAEVAAGVDAEGNLDEGLVVNGDGGREGRGSGIDPGAWLGVGLADLANGLGKWD